MSNDTAQLGGKIEISEPQTFCPKTNIKPCYSLSSNGKGDLTEGNEFNEHEIHGFKIFLNKIFPYMDYNAAIRKNDSSVRNININNANVLGSGTFGLAISYEDLVIKVLKSGCNFAFRPERSAAYKTQCTEIIETTNGNHGFNNTINEIQIINKIYTNQDKIYDLSVVPNSISKIYGYITFNTNIFNKLWEINPNLFNNISYYGNDPVFPISNIPNLFKSHIKDIYDLFELEQYNKSRVYYPNLELGYLSYVLMEKATDDLVKHYYLETKVFSTPLKHYIKLLTDMHEALTYFKSRRLIHQDIKADNIVIKEQAGLPQYQLIDFGLVKNVNALVDGPKDIKIYELSTANMVTHSEQFVIIKINGQNVFYYHYAYDYLCVLFALFDILKFTNWKGVFIIKDIIKNQPYDVKSTSPRQLYEIFSNFINTYFSIGSLEDKQTIIDIVMLIFGYVTIVRAKIENALNIGTNPFRLTKVAAMYLSDRDDEQTIPIILGMAKAERNLSINQILRELDNYRANVKLENKPKVEQPKPNIYEPKVEQPKPNIYKPKEYIPPGTNNVNAQYDKKMIDDLAKKNDDLQRKLNGIEIKNIGQTTTIGGLENDIKTKDNRIQQIEKDIKKLTDDNTKIIKDISSILAANGYICNKK